MGVLLFFGPEVEESSGLVDDANAGLVTVVHLDAEVFSGLARLNRAGELTTAEVDELLRRRLASLEVRRVPIAGALLEAAWRMRDNVAARDALYVAAARGRGCALLTTDDRLAEGCQTSRFSSPEGRFTTGRGPSPLASGMVRHPGLSCGTG